MSAVAGFLDIFFYVFHTLLILFNLFAWIWRKTRRINLITLILTGLSWTLLGIWYGFGYCPCTDWHWQVRMQLGHYDMPVSYITFLIKSLTGIDLNARLVDIFTLLFFLLALGVSAFLNIRDWKCKRKPYS